MNDISNRLRENGPSSGFGMLMNEAANFIESQTKIVLAYIDQHGRDSAELRRLCDERDKAKERVKALEAKCALLAASLAQSEREVEERDERIAALSTVAPALKAQPAAIQVGDGVTVTNVPARIYLNLGDLYGIGEIPFQSLTGVTWCADRIDDTDIEYVRGAESAQSEGLRKDAVPDGVEVASYRLADDPDVTVQCIGQVTGPDLWAVRYGGNCLGKNGEWEYEPMPSGRNDEFLARCRFASAQEAIDAAISQHTGEKDD